MLQRACNEIICIFERTVWPLWCFKRQLNIYRSLISMKVKWVKRKKVINLQLTLIFKIRLLYCVFESFPDYMPAITLPTLLSFNGSDMLILGLQCILLLSFRPMSRIEIHDSEQNEVIFPKPIDNWLVNNGIVDPKRDSVWKTIYISVRRYPIQNL